MQTKTATSIRTSSDTNNEKTEWNEMSEDEILEYLLKNKIYVKDNLPIMAPIRTFDELAPYIKRYLLKNIKSEYIKPTPVQMQTLPILIQNSNLKIRRELLVSAPKGSGKTTAFVIPILHHLRAPKKTGLEP